MDMGFILMWLSESSLVQIILPISKEASPASVLGRVWCDVSSRTSLAGLSAFLHKAKCILFYSRVSHGGWGGLVLALVT